MKINLLKIFASCIFILYTFIVFAQSKTIDSLESELQNAKQDTTRLRLNLELASVSDINDALSLTQTAQTLADKLLSQSPDESTRKKILNGKAAGYWLMADKYSSGSNLDLEKSIQLLQSALKLLEEMNDTEGIVSCYQYLSYWYLSMGNYPKGLEMIQTALSKAKAFNYRKGIALSYAALADMYRDQEENGQALANYENALAALSGTKDTVDLRNVLAAMGGFYYKNHNMKKSLEYYHKVISLYEAQKQHDKIGLAYQWIGDAYSFNNDYANALLNYEKSLTLLAPTDRKDKMRQVNDAIGTVYFKDGNFEKAIDFHIRALKVAEEMKSETDIASSCLNLAKAYHQKGNDVVAKKYSDRSIAILKSQNDLLNYADAELLASRIDSASGNGMSAFSHYKNYNVLEEKLKADEIHKAAQKEKFQSEFDKQQQVEKAEQEKKDIRQRNIRNSIAAGLTGALIFLVVVFRQRNKISKARKRSDELLLNILPKEVAEELKATGSTTARDFESVTVMFTDFKNFTAMSEKLTAQELVNEINYCYSAFDNIITKHGIEKIKTIGDSYMCAGGLPVANKTNSVDTVTAAIEIRDFMLNEKQKRKAEGKPFFEIRIGCNTGSVVAGIVGIKKFAYDIWGDTVNIASRMESSGEAGKINISGSTYELVKDKFSCTHRGKIEAKNKGMIDMYFVESSI